MPGFLRLCDTYIPPFDVNHAARPCSITQRVRIRVLGSVRHHDLSLLVHYRPYMAVRTFWIDVHCYLCLIGHFVLHAIASTVQPRLQVIVDCTGDIGLLKKLSDSQRRSLCTRIILRGKPVLVVV